MSENLVTAFVCEVRRRREAKGWSQRTLAAMLANLGHLRDPSAITRLEAGERTVSLAEALILARLLSIDLTALRGESSAGTPNQRVSYHLRRARLVQDWTQSETAERLTKATGRTWTAETLGAAERAWQTGRVRRFDADELVAFCEVFGLGIEEWLLPIPAHQADRVAPVGGTS